MVYAYKAKARISVPAQVAGEMCEQLAADGELTPKRLLDANRDEAAPLHSEFEWDDAVAAEEYRESQAAYIIRHIVVKPEAKEASPVRAFFSVEQDERKAYQSLEVILSTPSLREQLMQSARREMIAFQTKYASLSDLQPVFDAMKLVG